MKLRPTTGAGNWSREIGERYMRATFYEAEALFAQGQGEEGDPCKPLKFKVYRGVDRYPLSQTLPLALGDARWSFERFRRARQPAPYREGLDVGGLSTLLYYTYGLSRMDAGPSTPWPFHRLVPSARCFFPTELYLWVPRVGDIPAGFYHYDNLHHQLAALRAGRYGKELGRALGADLEGALCVLLVSSLFWKNAFKYRNYSYRLCTQEAGMVAGNALMVGGAMGLRGHVHYQFLDEPVNRLLGLEPHEESTFAVIAVYPWDPAEEPDIAPRSRIADDGDALDDSVEPIAPSYVKMGGFDRDLCGLVAEMDRNSLLSSRSEFAVEPHHRQLPSCAPSEEGVLGAPSPRAERPCVELAGALRSRDSGNVSFNPIPVPIGATALWEIVRYALSPYVCDLRRAASALPLHLFVAVNNVRGVPRGLYRYCGLRDGLHLVERRDLSMALQRLVQTPNINSCSSNMVVFLAGDYPAASDVFGNRAYRMLNMESGLVAQRICVMSAANGLAARITNGYNVERTEELLGLGDSALTPTFQIVIGRDRPGVRYKLPIRF